MSAYTTIALGTATMPTGAPLTELTNPSVADAADMITKISAELDLAFVGGGGTLPITDATLLSVFGFYATREFQYCVLTAMGAWSPDSAKPYWAKWHDEYKAFLKQLNPAGNIDTGAESSALPMSHTMDADPDASDPDVLNSQVAKSKVF